MITPIRVYLGHISRGHKVTSQSGERKALSEFAFWERTPLQFLNPVSKVSRLPFEVLCHLVLKFLFQPCRYNPKATNTAPTTVRMNVPRFEPELKHYIPPVQAALSLSPGSLKAFSASSDVFPSFVPRMRAVSRTKLRYNSDH